MNEDLEKIHQYSPEDLYKKRKNNQRLNNIINNIVEEKDGEYMFSLFGFGGSGTKHTDRYHRHEDTRTPTTYSRGSDPPYYDRGFDHSEMAAHHEDHTEHSESSHDDYTEHRDN